MDAKTQLEISSDKEFFYSLIVFQVESQLFKVPRKPFIEESEVFRDMFKLPEAEDVESDGVDETHPLRLDGIHTDDFRAFLRALYAAQHHSPLTQTQEEWLSALKLAHMWAFTDLREQCIKRLDTSSMSAIQRIHVARHYEIPGWVPKAYSELVAREGGLTDDEAEELGWYDAFKISRFREQKMAKLIGHFKSGHARPRECRAGHSHNIPLYSTICKPSKCGKPIDEKVTDGCEIFRIALQNVQ